LIQEPDLLIDWYNSIVEWLAEVSSHHSLQQLSWPVPEFSGTKPILSQFVMNTLDKIFLADVFCFYLFAAIDLLSVLLKCRVLQIGCAVVETRVSKLE